MRLLVGSLLTVLAFTIGLWAVGAGDLASWASMLGTVGVLGLVLVYVVAVDSRRRWPEADWLVRLGRIFFFVR